MAIPTLDFGELSLRDALDLAVLIEEESKERYEELANQMLIHRNLEAERFFWKMVQIELTHERKLSFRRKRLFHHEPVRVTRAMLFDVEAPEYDQVRATMSVREALGVALSAEKKAYAFFETTLPAVKDPQARELFTELRNEELEHCGMVEAELARLPPEPMMTTDDFADEPVAH